MSKFTISEKLTIGVASYGNIKTTEICVNKILDSVEGNFELILVEDFSHERDKIINFYQSIKKRVPNTKIFNFDRNLTYTNSVNCILSHATGKKVLFVSNDVFINPYYVEEILKISNLSKKIGVVRGVTNYVDNGGLKTHNVKIEGNPKSITHEDIMITAKKYFKTYSGKYLEDKYLSGDIFLVKREVLDNVGFFDTNTFTGYFSDHDFSSRVISNGYLCVLAQGAFAFAHQDINFNYLDPEKAQRKKNLRFQQAFENWARFKIKYSLPNDLNYNGINNVPWEKTFEKKTKYIDKVDYSKYLQ